MKLTLFSILLALVSLSGCNIIEDNATISIPTSFKTDIPVLITGLGVKSSQIENPASHITFSESQDLYLEDNADVEPYLEKIKTIDLEKVEIKFTGLTDGQIIDSLSLDVENIGNIITLKNISKANNTFSPVITDGLLDKVGAKFINDKKITISVHGSVSEPMSFTVGLDIDADVIAYLLK